jgi:murein DD-endopeptidase MepM/ murein hydrolase activator NlpD
MKTLVLSLIVIPLLANASVGDDINALLDRFFGGDQAPMEELDPAPLVVPDIPSNFPMMPVDDPGMAEPSADTVEIRREIMQQEAELEAFEAELRTQERETSQLKSEILTSQQQLQLVDEQIELNRRKLDFYDAQVKEWQTLVETLTREKSGLRAQIRIMEREYQSLLSKKFIQKQNFQLNPTLSWWQWMFSERTVSELLNERRQSSVDQNSQADGLENLQRLKTAFEAQELEAVTALSTVSDLEQKLLKDQIILNDLAEAKATLLGNLNESEATEGQRLAQLRAAQSETTRYLQNLRQELAQAPVLAENQPEEERITTLQWPLETPVTISAGFKDPQYEINYEREHLGIDLIASQGSDVLAAGEGLVNKIATDASGYTYLILQHDPDLYSIYGHLSNTLVEEGTPVIAGQVIAWSGGTPGTPGAGFFTSGPHLHFEVFSGGQFLDPLLFLPE